MSETRKDPWEEPSAKLMLAAMDQLRETFLAMRDRFKAMAEPDLETCEECEGSGKVDSGRGWPPTMTCPTCNGEGVVEKEA